MTKILYITSRCNFKCDYCYENQQVENYTEDTTTAIIDTAIQDLKSDLSPECLVLFGGEPFLRYDLLQYALLKLVTEEVVHIHPTITTNGFFFSSLNNLKNFVSFYNTVYAPNNKKLSIELSYDKSGQFRRRLRNGGSSEDFIVKALNNISSLYNTHLMPDFKLRYTIHQGNVDNIFEDIEYLLQTYPFASRIVTSVVGSEVDKSELFAQVSKFNSLFSKYGKPICEYCCGICKNCTKTNSNKYFTFNNIIVSEKVSTTPFNHFK